LASVRVGKAGLGFGVESRADFIETFDGNAGLVGLRSGAFRFANWAALGGAQDNSLSGSASNFVLAMLLAKILRAPTFDLGSACFAT
jgi:hypothetical protein